MTVNVGFRTIYQKHAEQVVHSYDGTPIPQEAHIWPSADELGAVRSREPLNATLDGVCAGRCFFEAEHYPFAELQNLVVAPQSRGKGVGDALVADAIKRALELGYLAIHLQVARDNTVAHRLYTKHGFLPAQQGELLKMIRFLDYPALALFLSRHPLALPSSRRNSTGALWEMKWEDAVSHDSIAILPAGGSCQADSDGFGPGVGAFELRCGGVQFRADVSAPNEVSKGREFVIGLRVENSGSTEIEGSCRLLLNSGFAPGGDTKGSASLRVAPGASESMALPVIVAESFDEDFWKYSCFRSVPVCVEVRICEHVFWLAKQVKVG